MENPYLIITIDTEEGFDWSKPFTHTEYQTSTLFDHDSYLSAFYKAENIQPICIVSYPILNDPACQVILKQQFKDDIYTFGTHLHSWVTPPYEEILCNANSYAANLPLDLRKKKITELTNKFIDVMGYQPLHYKCGRYSIANSTYNILQSLGYEFDFSPYAHRNYSRFAGPNFTHIKNQIYTLPKITPNEKIFTIYPGTADYVGICKNNALLKKIYSMPFFEKLKSRAILSRFKLLDFIPLTPEGTHLDEMIFLTKSLHKKNQKLFHMSYHASSFTPHQSPYCCSIKDAILMTDTIRRYIDFFRSIGGQVIYKGFDLKKNTIYKPDLKL